MGCVCAKYFEDDEDHVKIMRFHLLVILRQQGTDELLNFAARDRMNYEICKNNDELRQGCIVAATRRFYNEKFLHEDVYNRTADYMLLLDDFINIQNGIDEQRQLEEARSEPNHSVRRRNRLEAERNLGKALSC
ncbi:hypothetical protein TcasGA2_TC010823 [Tribolium castaneum]|uniref:Uncharacterized protein n=1 Tax=Tribolium castaneum TaxID=7070 RepID=D6W7H4_TRICA|nr:PREDICTED: uncharacterized protein LOC107397794 [Tribolium castaneum]EFA11287.1 hypothetical protein TcasGA2_TC010823 [Tribolium castaneum]|eukprot:XP_015834796.1 PREDICTED: uncharacterized protein LOC107397794 [Tribolium castaneum]